jgi:SWI/SNF-related matrix-associated actin-dependent regulator of chromatin subfamily A3
MVELPPKTVLECCIDLSEEEREIYDRMELEGKNKMQEFGDRDSILRNYSTVLYFILRLRQLCDDVSLCPLDVKSWLPSNSLEGMSFSYLVYFDYVTTCHDEVWPEQVFHMFKMIIKTLI